MTVFEKWFFFIIVVIICLCLIILPGCGGNIPIKPVHTTTPTQTQQTPVNPSNYQWGVQMKKSGCRASQSLPDALCTPGDIFKTATAKIICVAGYTQTVRNVPIAEKNMVYQEYGIVSHSPGQYEIDHLVPLELGGSNAISNLWPELASPTPGFHQKDVVENDLHSKVCSGKMELLKAQIEIATNWLQDLK